MEGGQPSTAIKPPRPSVSRSCLPPVAPGVAGQLFVWCELEGSEDGVGGLSTTFAGSNEAIEVVCPVGEVGEGVAARVDADRVAHEEGGCLGFELRHGAIVICGVEQVVSDLVHERLQGLQGW